MCKLILLSVAAFLLLQNVSSQDSVWVRLKPKYDQVSKLHRKFFGENYRKEWADSTLLPVLDISSIDGGLKPVRLGGGHQTISLRLVGKSGSEWVLRNVEKDASVVLPPELRKTFARDLVDDAMSAQHPFSPLAVAILAEAAGVPHANPKIGVIKADTALGDYTSKFAGRVCLLEEREPMGKSENSQRLFRDLVEDNDNSIDGEAFLKARLLDLLIGDWDRHADQWRWVDVKKGKSKLYIGIPRDRDQAFYVNQGAIPWLASRPWFVPSLQGFTSSINNVRYSLKEGSFLYSWPGTQLSKEKWDAITLNFLIALTDEVLQNALQAIPEPARQRRHNDLLGALKKRRDALPAAMNQYYTFINRIVDVQLSNKAEHVLLLDSGKNFILKIDKITKKGMRENIFSQKYSAAITKELRVYTGAGKDSIFVDNKIPVLFRLVSGEGDKNIRIVNSSSKIRVYAKNTGSTYEGEMRRLQIKKSHDSLHTAYVPTNRYNILKPLLGFGFNRDDGFILGLGFQYIQQGFRKIPYASKNRLMLYHSFATNAYRIRYSGEWLHLLGKTDLVGAVDIFAPQNTQNFFGRGNETVFNKTGDHITFYRSRFSLYQMAIGVQWRLSNEMKLSIVPTLQHYRYDSSENSGRFLSTGKVTGSYDSATLSENRTHVGLVMNFVVNRKNHPLLPNKGYMLLVRMQGFAGASDHSSSFAQLIPEFSLYTSLNTRRTLVLANRTGGGITVGKTAFYQSLFAGGQENLLGFRQYRFAGEQLLYNNTELRMRVANFTGYVIPGEFGVLAFYDIGRVWVKNEKSTMWHQGKGGGVYFAPASLAVLSIVAGHSNEGWYPYITLGFRF